MIRPTSITMPLSDYETITVVGTLQSFEVKNQSESGSLHNLGRYEKGRWHFDSPFQQTMFFNLFDHYRGEFDIAIRSFRQVAL
jgi:hypothetical protein